MYTQNPKLIRFNPLTGVSCNVVIDNSNSYNYRFQSPHGCELQRLEQRQADWQNEFQSPRGCELQLDDIGNSFRNRGFNPLAGVSCNAANLKEVLL